jgi:hypothetical protein
MGIPPFQPRLPGETTGTTNQSGLLRVVRQPFTTGAGLRSTLRIPSSKNRTSSSSLAIPIRNHPFGSQASAGREVRRPFALCPGLATGLPFSRMKRLQACLRGGPANGQAHHSFARKTPASGRPPGRPTPGRRFRAKPLLGKLCQIRRLSNRDFLPNHAMLQLVRGVWCHDSCLSSTKAIEDASCMSILCRQGFATTQLRGPQFLSRLSETV